MSQYHYQILRVADEIQPPDAGKQSIVVTDVENTNVVLFSVSLK